MAATSHEVDQARGRGVSTDPAARRLRHHGGMTTPALWAAFAASLLLTAGSAAALLLPAQASPGYLAGMAGLLLLGMTGATAAKLVLWTRGKS